jgi:hypothetical protein
MINARRTFTAVMGTWMGLAGIEHGIGEIMQGNVTPKGIMILSWPDSAFFESLSGEPAMTIVPDLLATGILAVLFSLLFAIWSIFFIQRKHGGLVLMLLAVPMLLFGAGIFPPFLGALIGAAAAVPVKAESSAVNGLGRWMGRGWPWIFAACCLAWIALLPGVAVLDYFFGVERVDLTVAIIAAAFLLLFLSYWSSIQHDRLELSS